jgi:hypothetical protein
MAKPDGKSPNDHPGETGIVLEDYIPEVPPGKYDEYVKAMLAADAQIEETDPDGYAKGRRKQATIVSDSRTGTRTVKKPDGTETVEEVDLEVEKTIRLFQESARNHDRTGKVVGRRNNGDGTVILHFILAPKQRRPRKTADSGTDETTTPDTTQEATEAA